MGSIDSRLRRLEDEGRRGVCPECGLPPDGPGRIVAVDEERPEESFDGDPDERCAACGRLLWCVMRIVYDEEGGRALLDSRMHSDQARREPLYAAR